MTTLTIPNVVDRYCELNDQIKALKKEQDGLKRAMVGVVLASPDQCVDHDSHRITVTRRVSWTYSDSLKAQVNLLQAKERDKGVAQPRESMYPVVKMTN